MPYPAPEHTLVFIGASDKQMLQAATYAARHGFSRTAILAGGTQGLEDTAVHKAKHQGPFLAV